MSTIASGRPRREPRSSCAVCGASFGLGEPCRSTHNGRELKQRHWGRPAAEARFWEARQLAALEAQSAPVRQRRREYFEAERTDYESRRFPT